MGHPTPRARRAHKADATPPHPPPSPQEDFLYEDMDALCGVLRTLATDSNKYRANAARRRQRCTFRAVLHSVEVRVRVSVS